MLGHLASAVLTAAEAANLGVSVSILEGQSLRRVYVSDAAARILGYPVEELVRASTLMTFAPEELGRINKISEDWSQGRPVPRLLETVVARKDGTRVPIEVAYSEVTLDGKPATIAFLRDITERKKTENALKRSEQLFRKLIEAAPEGVIVSRAADLIYANPRLLRILGCERLEDLPKKSVSDLIHSDDRAAFADLERDILASSSHAAAAPPEFRLLTRFGGFVWVECSSLGIDFEGAPAQLTFMRDVTERKRAQAELIQSDRMATVSTLAATVAHELNNPLAYVLLNLALLEREVAALPAARETRDGLTARLLTLQEGAERMATIVRDLRAFCRPAAPLIAPIDVEQVLESAINMAMHELKDRARVVRVYAPVPTVNADAAQLGQVFLNLLLNAAQALPAGSTKDNEVRVTIGGDGRDRVWIEVSDTGQGIAPEARPRIFEPFFTTKPLGIGTGLGLSICHSIVSNLKGEITVESEVGRGSKFRVYLPASSGRAADDSAAPSAPDSAPRTPRARILVVDDEPLIVAALAKMLEVEHDVASATSGEQALELLQQGTDFDVILCDLTMPGTSGIDVYRDLERHRSDLAERIIFMSGAASMPTISDFLSGVQNHHIDKPVDLAELRALIRETHGKTLE
jgi:PAS domain S-box-containing protein